MKPTFRRRLYDFFTQYWYWSAFILTLSANWFVFVRVFGESVGLVEAGGKMRAIGHYISWPVFLISIVFAFAKTWGDRKNERGKESGQAILESVLAGVNAVTSHKMRRFCTYIKKNRNSKEVYAFRDITQPRNQIESLLENINITLSGIFAIKRDHIGVSVLFKFLDHGQWDWLSTINMDDDLGLQDLISNPNTSARQIIDGKERAVFFPDKRIGARENKYVFGPKDKGFNGIGSILCQDISIGDSEKYVQAILSITTYGKQICRVNDQAAKQTIEHGIVSTFVTRLKLELMLLYTKEVLSPQCLVCPTPNVPTVGVGS